MNHTNSARGGNAQPARKSTESSVEEVHVFQFRGVFVSAELFSLCLTRQITFTDLGLFLMIDALSSDKEACYATNRYLADALKVNLTYLSGRIKHLKDLKLLKVTYGTRKGRGTRWLSAVQPKVAQPGEDHGEDPNDEIEAGLNRGALGRLSEAAEIVVVRESPGG